MSRTSSKSAGASNSRPAGPERMTSGLSQALASVSQWALAETPFGGSKDSGYGREGGPTAIRDYLDTKFVNLAVPAAA